MGLLLVLFIDQKQKKFMASKIVVNQSKIHGKGIFAKRDIKKGEIVLIIKGPEIFKINQTLKDVLDNPDWVGFKINHWIDPTPPYKYLNHSCNPNAGIRGQKTLIALHNIKKDEEITIDYSITEVDPRWQMSCSCNSDKCRGIIKSIQSLPSEIYKKYYPNISSEFQKIYERTNFDR